MSSNSIKTISLNLTAQYRLVPGTDSRVIYYKQNWLFHKNKPSLTIDAIPVSLTPDLFLPGRPSLQPLLVHMIQHVVLQKLRVLVQILDHKVRVHI